MTPKKLFGAIIGVGLLPAIGTGMLIGVSNKDYHPIPQPSTSPEAYANFGDAPEGYTEPPRKADRVKPTKTYTYRTPHAERTRSKVNVPERSSSLTPTPSKRSPSPKTTTSRPVATHATTSTAPTPTGEAQSPRPEPSA